jgi:hypothetical protein
MILLPLRLRLVTGLMPTAFALVLLMLGGCQSSTRIEGSKVTAEARNEEVRPRTTVTTIITPGESGTVVKETRVSDGGMVKSSEIVTGSGASGSSTGDKAELGIDGSAPAAGLSGGGNALGGTMKAIGKSQMNLSSVNLLMVLGGLVLASSIAVWFYFPLFRKYAQAGMVVGAVVFGLGWLVTGGTAMLVLIGGAACIAGVVIWAVKSGNLTIEQNKQRAQAAEVKAATVEADAKSIVNSLDVLRADPKVGPTVQAAMAEKKDAMQLKMTDGAKQLIASEKTT